MGEGAITPSDSTSSYLLCYSEYLALPSSAGFVFVVEFE